MILHLRDILVGNHAFGWPPENLCREMRELHHRHLNFLQLDAWLPDAQGIPDFAGQTRNADGRMLVDCPFNIAAFFRLCRHRALWRLDDVGYRLVQIINRGDDLAIGVGGLARFGVDAAYLQRPVAMVDCVFVDHAARLKRGRYNKDRTQRPAFI